MKTRNQRLWLALLWMCLPAAWLHAQLGIEVEADRETYLQHEPIVLNIRVRNYTQEPLDFGREMEVTRRQAVRSPDSGDVIGYRLVDEEVPAGYMSLEIRNIRGDHVRTLKLQTTGGEDVSGSHQDTGIAPEVNPITRLKLPAGASKAMNLRVNEYYDLAESGVYTMRLRIGHHALDTDYLSQPVSFKIVEPTVFWQRDVGLPRRAFEGTVDKRKYQILTYRHEDGETYVLRVRGSERDRKTNKVRQLIYGTVRLGPKVNNVKPQFEIDQRGNIHILFQTHSRMFSYWVYDYRVQRKQFSYYMVKPGIPYLNYDTDTGRVIVRGGALAVEGVDYSAGDEELEIMTIGAENSMERVD